MTKEIEKSEEKCWDEKNEKNKKQRELKESDMIMKDENMKWKCEMSKELRRRDKYIEKMKGNMRFKMQNEVRSVLEAMSKPFDWARLSLMLIKWNEIQKWELESES